MPEPLLHWHIGVAWPWRSREPQYEATYATPGHTDSVGHEVNRRPSTTQTDKVTAEHRRTASNIGMEEHRKRPRSKHHQRVGYGELGPGVTNTPTTPC